MTPEQPGKPGPAYEVTFLDGADADIEAAFTYLRGFVGDDKAETWARQVYQAGYDLVEFPGPLAHPVDEEVSRLTGRTVRRMRFQGGTRQKPIGAKYRIYFYTVEAESDAERDGLFILRVLHGAVAWPAEENQEGK